MQNNKDKQNSMMNNEKPKEKPKPKPNHFVEILKTNTFGLIQLSSKFHGMQPIETKLLSYYISKIKVELKSNQYITGIIVTFTNRTDNTNIDVINIPSKKKSNLEQDFVLDSTEFITDVRVWVKERLTGFEITTNKGTIRKFGYGEEGSMVRIPELIGGDQVIVGFEVCADEKDGITGMACYYLSKNKYSTVLHTGLRYLKIKLKDDFFKQKIEKKIQNLSDEYRTLFHACLLPDNTFFEVMKYIVT